MPVESDVTESGNESDRVAYIQYPGPEPFLSGSKNAALYHSFSVGIQYEFLLEADGLFVPVTIILNKVYTPLSVVLIPTAPDGLPLCNQFTYLAAQNQLIKFTGLFSISGTT